MTLIECFTETHLDNLVACLSLRPEKMILLGEKEQLGDPLDRYRAILKERRQRTKIETCFVDENNVHNICKKVRELLLLEDDVVIDMTGGDELVFMAIGAVVSSLSDEQLKNIRVQKMDPEDGLIHDCLHPGVTYPCKCADLTIKEMLLLGEGKLCKHEHLQIEGAKLSDLDGLWDIIAEDPDGWNKTLSYLIEFESKNQKPNYDEFGYLNLNVELSIKALRREINGFSDKYTTVVELLGKLSGPVLRIHSNDEMLKYTYNSRVLRYCTQKVGNTLEVKTLLAGKSVLKNGVPFFRDGMMGVEILWEGESRFAEGVKPRTKNEIDVILMHGTVPVFISCKNGAVKEDELYKFNTVATRFGGKHAVKLLMATHIDDTVTSNRSIMQRAWNMDIQLITDADRMTKQEWRDTLMDAFAPDTSN